MRACGHYVTMLGSYRLEMRWGIHLGEACICERLSCSCVEFAGSACTCGGGDALVQVLARAYV